jgi:hypothetical protein
LLKDWVAYSFIWKRKRRRSDAANPLLDNVIFNLYRNYIQPSQLFA